MAKNLTNYQLDILTDKIYKNLFDKKINNKLLKDIEGIVKENLEYNKLIKLIKEYETLDKQSKLLQESIGKIKKEFRDKLNTPMYSYPDPSVEFLDSKVKEFTNKEIGKLVPSKGDIKSEVVLSSISGSKDIINDILSKYE